MFASVNRAYHMHSLLCPFRSIISWLHKAMMLVHNVRDFPTCRRRWRPLRILIAVGLLLVVCIHGLAVPESELVNRRKSPALWREDLKELPEDTTKRKILQRPPEVMAPVGGFPQLQAAIGNGADSVYLGLSAFSARARATNFDPKTELPQAIKMAHDAGVKVYVALNTLVFNDELQEVQQLIAQCAKANVDALIVQDLGLARLARKVAPNLEVHASTQQTITSADGASFAAELLGSTRVVLGRELSVSEIQSVSDNLADDVEIEAFVHGALCVSYSGQCFSSEAWGGRSANRGQCAQACRLPYGLIDNGELRELGDFSYLLSPQDLCGLDNVPQLLEAGVSCLKIEGRLKDPAYVAATTRAYRNAVDNAWREYCKENSLPVSFPRHLEPESVSMTELAQIFSRGQDESNDGLSSGFFEGSKHQTLVRGRSPRHRGVHAGRVQKGSSWRNGLVVRVDGQVPLKLGDGIVVDRGLAQEEELGGSIFDIQDIGNDLQIVRFSHDVEKQWRDYDEKAGSAVGLAPVDAHVWKTSDASTEKKMRRLSSLPAPKKAVSARVAGKIGEPLRVSIEGGGIVGEGSSTDDLSAAERSPLSVATLKKAIGSLGNTEWSIDGDIDTSGLEDGCWCPISQVKDARRRAVEDFVSNASLDLAGSSSRSDKEVDLSILPRLVEEAFGEDPSQDEEEVALSVLARSPEQVEQLCIMVESGMKVSEIIIDFLEVEGMQEAVTRARVAGVRTVVASPRIIKPGESGIWRTLLRLEPDALLVRSTGLLYRLMKAGGTGEYLNVGGDDSKHMVRIPGLIGDFSLNVANSITAWELLKYGCSRVTASYDLSAHAITELLDSMGPGNARHVEVVAHAHLPIFHTEHCVFARFLSKGNSYVDCGHACTRHSVHLRDQTGSDNLVLADMGCRNTVFAAQAQSGAYSLHTWMDAGATRFRVELVDEPPEDVEVIVRGYLNVLEGRQSPKELWQTLETIRDGNGRHGGVSVGSFRNSKERRAGEIR